MKLTDPKLYRVDSYTWRFMTRLRKELLRAYQNMTKQKAPTASPTIATETPPTVTPPRPSDANILGQKLAIIDPATGNMAVITMKRDEVCAHQEQQWEQKLQVQQVQQEPNPKHIQAMESGSNDPETLPMPVPVLATMIISKLDATPTPGCMIQVCGQNQLLGLRGTILSHAGDNQWRVLLQNMQQYLLTQKDLLILVPPPTDQIHPAPSNMQTLTLTVIDTDNSSPTPCQGPRNELLWARNSIKENSANLQSEQNTTPDSQSYDPNASKHISTSWSDQPSDDQDDLEGPPPRQPLRLKQPSNRALTYSLTS